MTAALLLLAMVTTGRRSRGSSDSLPLSKYVPVNVNVPSGVDGATDNLRVMVPSKPGERRIADPATLFDHVKGAWDTVVAKNQAGLMDAKHQMAKPQPLSARESWHHYQAGQQGVVDSARFLITFGLIPSVQSGGSPLYVAASMGDVAALRRLLDDGADVDEEKVEDGQTALHAAATMGHAAVAHALLESGAHVDAEAKNGATPLMMAAAMGHVDVARTLIEFSPRGAAVDAAHRYAKTTALHWAAEMGRASIVELLCASGANVEAAKITGGTALHTASDANQSATVRVLLAPPCGADHTKLLVGDTVPLYLAAQRGFTEVGEALIEGGAAVNFVMPTGKFKMKVATRDQGAANGAPHYPEKNLEIGNGATVLHAAVENGHLRFTEMLLRHGAQQSGSMEGATPLIIALQYRHPRIAKTLLAAGGAAARINARVPKDGASALFVAAGSGYAEVVELLIAAGADLNIANNHGATPLSHAVARGRLGMAKRLLRAGADAAAATSDGQTVLHAAAQRGDARAAALLLTQRGVAVDAATADGVTPLHAASSSGRARLVQLLLDAGASVAARVASTGVTPLMMAAKAGSVDAVRALLSAGANASAVANTKLYGAGALYLACQNTHRAVAALLLDAGADVNARLRSIHVTPLFIAAERGDAALVSLLIGRGAKVGARNWNGLTPLGMAALQNRDAALAALLASGARVDARDKEGTTPLLAALAQRSGAPSTLKALLAAGANLDAIDANGTGAVLHAVASDRRESAKTQLVAFLAQRGAAIDAPRRGDGVTPLRLAVQRNWVRLATQLVDLGADVEQRADAGSATLLCASVAAARLALSKALLRAGASATTRCAPQNAAAAREDGDTPRTRAVATREFDLIALLSGAEAAEAARAEAAAAAAAAPATPAALAGAQFAAFDSDGSGALSRIELVKGLKFALGHSVVEGNRARFEALFQRLDRNGDRAVDASEFELVERSEL